MSRPRLDDLDVTRLSRVATSRDVIGRESADAAVLASLTAAGLQDVTACDAMHGGLVRHVLAGDAPFLLVQDAAARASFGTIGIRGAFPGFDPARMIHVGARNARDALWAMEEGVKAGLHVIGEIEGSPRALDFTATRRLEHFAQAACVGCMLVRVGSGTATHGSSGARRRWRVSARPSLPDPFDPRAPGRPRWCLELLRARDRAPGRWIVEPDRDGCDAGFDARSDAKVDAKGDVGRSAGAAHRLRLVPPLAAGDLGAGAGPAAAGGDPALGGGAGRVVAFPGRAA